MTYEQWCQAINKMRGNKGWTFGELGERAAESVSRARPFSSSTVHRVLVGHARSRAVETALGHIFDFPFAGNQEYEDEDIREWLELGIELKQIAPVWFGKLLGTLGEQRDGLKKRIPEK